MAIVLGTRRLGNYRSVCQLRAPGDARNACGNPWAAMVKGRRWAACKGKRGQLRLVLPSATPVVTPMPQPPPLPKEHRVGHDVLRAYVGNPSWSVWKSYLAKSGVKLKKGKGNAYEPFTRAQCRAIMEAAYRSQGRRKMSLLGLKP